MLKNWLVVAVIALLITSCGGKRIVLDGSNKATKDGISLSMNWIKDKGKKFDAHVTIGNDSEHDIIVMLDDMTCGRGTTSGVLKHTFFNTGERTIDIRKGGSKSFNMVCVLGSKVGGDIKLGLGRIYIDKKGDGVKRGKVYTEGIHWVQPVKDE